MKAGEGGGPDLFFLKVWGASSFLLERKLSSIFRLTRKRRVVFFRLPREKGGLLLPTEGQTELSSFLDGFAGPVCFLDLGLSSFS